MGTKAAPAAPITEKLTSVNNPYVKHCVRLRTNHRYRREVGRLILSGTQVLQEVFGEFAVDLGIVPEGAESQTSHGVDTSKRITT